MDTDCRLQSATDIRCTVDVNYSKGYDLSPCSNIPQHYTNSTSNLGQVLPLMIFSARLGVARRLKLHQQHCSSCRDIHPHANHSVRRIRGRQHHRRWPRLLRVRIPPRRELRQVPAVRGSVHARPALPRLHLWPLGRHWLLLPEGILPAQRLLINDVRVHYLCERHGR